MNDNDQEHVFTILTSHGLIPSIADDRDMLSPTTFANWRQSSSTHQYRDRRNLRHGAPIYEAHQPNRSIQTLNRSSSHACSSFSIPQSSLGLRRFHPKHHILNCSRLRCETYQSHHIFHYLHCRESRAERRIVLPSLRLACYQRFRVW